MYKKLKKLYPELLDHKIVEIRYFNYLRKEFDSNERNILMKFAEKLEGI